MWPKMPGNRNKLITSIYHPPSYCWLFKTSCRGLNYSNPQKQCQCQVLRYRQCRWRRGNDNENEDIIQYGCCAHMLNLLVQDVEINGVYENIVKVIKYFRNKHLRMSRYIAAGDKSLVMLITVRLKTTGDCIRSYLANLGILVQTRQNDKNYIDNNNIEIVNDVKLQATQFNCCHVWVQLLEL